MVGLRWHQLKLLAMTRLISCRPPWSDYYVQSLKLYMGDPLTNGAEIFNPLLHLEDEVPIYITRCCT
jgi:hypothetical protein